MQWVLLQILMVVPTSEVGTSINVDDLRKETPKSFRRKDLDASEEQLDV